MKPFPFQIPKSLESHLEMFGMDPQKAIHNLERHLKRRGYDAVGHFLLAWFHYNQGDRENTLEFATKAKTYAPGSPFFENLPYYFAHPDGFEAWIPEESHDYHSVMRPVPKKNRLSVDLDNLITRLSEVETSKIEVKEDTPIDHDKKIQPVADGIATETLARIYENQHEIEIAINIYKKIMQRNPEKAKHCEKEIARLKSLK